MELVLTMIIIGILGALSVSMIGGGEDARKFEDTKAKMEKIRLGILGDDSLDKDGHRRIFGYHGDWGGLPTTLSDLVTAKSPAWVFDSVYGVGGGWKSVYWTPDFTDSSAVTKDGWGTLFNYNPAASPPTLTSYGSDGAAGGSFFAKDLVMTFPTTVRLATVRGMVMDGVARLSGVDVELRYPVAGVVTAFTATTDFQTSAKRGQEPPPCLLYLLGYR